MTPLDACLRRILTDRATPADLRARTAAALIESSAPHLPPSEPFVWHRWLGQTRVEVRA